MKLAKIGAYAGVTVSVFAIVGGLFAFDARYTKTVEAAEYRRQADIDREYGDVELRTKLIELEMQLNQDQRREKLLHRQLEQLLQRQNRLIELQQGH